MSSLSELLQSCCLAAVAAHISGPHCLFAFLTSTVAVATQMNWNLERAEAKSGLEESRTGGEAPRCGDGGKIAALLGA